MLRNPVEAKKSIKGPYCPRCGEGVMIRDMGGFFVCGKCSLRQNKSLYKKQFFFVFPPISLRQVQPLGVHKKDSCSLQ